MKLTNEKSFKYYMEDPNLIKYRIKEIKEAIKSCDYMISHPQEAYTIKLDGVDEVYAYREYLYFELDTFKMLKRKIERGNY